jgi:hypothetical protein
MHRRHRRGGPLATALDRPGILACGPRRTLDRTGASLPVRWYYDVWERLPAVREGLFGRGVVAVSAQGHRRLAELPPVMADDLAMSAAFDPAERFVVPDAEVVVVTPRRWRDLWNRRVRVATGNSQVRAVQERAGAARTGLADLRGIVLQRPTMAPKVLYYAALAVAARRAARRQISAGDFDTWRRDASSRESA